MRSRNIRKLRKTYLILVDGETEIWYLQLMKDYEKLKEVRIKPEIPKRKKLKEQYETIKKAVSEGYDKIIWIVDLDSILGDKDKSIENEFKKYLNEWTNNKKIYVLVNNPCLEEWYLLHYRYTKRIFTDCSKVIKELKKNLKDYDKSKKYYKNQRRNIYKKLKSSQSNAIENARKLGDFNPKKIELAKAEIYKIFDILQIKQS